MGVYTVVATFSVLLTQIPELGVSSDNIQLKPRNPYSQLVNRIMKKFLTPKFWSIIKLPDIDRGDAQVYGGTFVPPYAVWLPSFNIFAPKRGELVLQLTVTVKHFMITYNGRTTFLFIQPHFQVAVYIQRIVVSIEISLSTSGMKVIKFEPKIDYFDVGFKFVGSNSEIANSLKDLIAANIKSSLSGYLESQFVQHGTEQLEGAFEEYTKKLKTEECVKLQCTPFEALVWEAMQRFGMDPAPLLPSSISYLSNLVGVLGRVNITSGAVYGLSRTRQSGLASIRVDEVHGLLVYVHLKVENIAVIVNMVLHTAIMNIAICAEVILSARFALNIREKRHPPQLPSSPFQQVVNRKFGVREPTSVAPAWRPGARYLSFTHASPKGPAADHIADTLRP
ncbi:uncharacterized protein LOC144168255 [Haemaphysalis longicornis]